jgi:CBS-domain-containing membrane protein
VTFELTVTCQLQAETLGEAVLEVERCLHRPTASIALSAMTGKVVPEPKAKETR